MPSPFQLIVFDLDFTLWDAGGLWCDCTSPPYRLEEGHVLDAANRHIRLYDDVHDILDYCDTEAIPMGLASRTGQPTWARELLQLLTIADRFAYEEIYPSSKLKHFRALHEESGIAYHDMLFFDDEMRNIDQVSQLGVSSIYVPDGMNFELFKNALR